MSDAGSALMHVQEFGCKDEVEATPCYQVTDMVFSSANGEEVTIRLPADRIADRINIVPVTSRPGRVAQETRGETRDIEAVLPGVPRTRVLPDR